MLQVEDLHLTSESESAYQSMVESIPAINIKE